MYLNYARHWFLAVLSVKEVAKSISKKRRKVFLRSSGTHYYECSLLDYEAILALTDIALAVKKGHKVDSLTNHFEFLESVI